MIVFHFYGQIDGDVSLGRDYWSSKSLEWRGEGKLR